MEKRSDTGDALSGVTIQIKHIETGETRTGQTRNGVIVFDELVPGGWEVRVLKDGWTTVTVDGSLAAHYENSILITKGEPEILTQVGDLRL